MELGIKRVVFKLPIEDERLIKPFKAGETIINARDYNWFKENYPNSIVEIPMNEQEWMEYLSYEAHKSYERAKKLQYISKRLELDVEPIMAFHDRTESLGDIALEGAMMEPKLYSGGGPNGLKNIVDKITLYKEEIDLYEENVFTEIGVKEKEGKKIK